MTPWTTFLRDVLPELPGADQPLVLYHVKDTCYDFYARSLYGKQWVTPIDVVQGTASYAAAPVDSTNFATTKVLEVMYQDGSAGRSQKLDPKSADDLDRDLPHWRVCQGRVSCYTQNDVDDITLALIPACSTAGGLKVRIAYAPLPSGAGIDDKVYQRFSREIAAGVKSRLMIMPKKPWSNPQLASKYERDFDLAVAGAAAMAAKEFGRAPLRTRAWG